MNVYKPSLCGIEARGRAPHGPPLREHCHDNSIALCSRCDANAARLQKIEIAFGERDAQEVCRDLSLPCRIFIQKLLSLGMSLDVIIQSLPHYCDIGGVQ
jgi:hypothetical protein